MHPTPQAHAVLLPTLSFGKSDAGNARPLSNSEWARFAVWLRDHDLAPASLLDSGWRDLVAGSTDSAVPLGRLESEGTAVGVLADGPLRSATSAKYRQHLVSNDLALVTPFSPEARFHVGKRDVAQQVHLLPRRRRRCRLQHAGTRRYLARGRREPEGGPGSTVGQTERQ